LQHRCLLLHNNFQLSHSGASLRSISLQYLKILRLPQPSSLVDRRCRRKCALTILSICELPVQDASRSNAGNSALPAPPYALQFILPLQQQPLCGGFIFFQLMIVVASGGKVSLQLDKRVSEVVHRCLQLSSRCRKKMSCATTDLEHLAP
jgi:hypothetical protein